MKRWESEWGCMKVGGMRCVFCGGLVYGRDKAGKGDGTDGWVCLEWKCGGRKRWVDGRSEWMRRDDGGIWSGFEVSPGALFIVDEEVG